jgi:hypothetical protein
VSNRRLPPRQTLPMPPAELGDPLCGLEAPECIEALERAAAELLLGTNLEPREIVRCLLANEGDRQAIEPGFVQVFGRLPSARVDGSSCRRPKTCTVADIRGCAAKAITSSLKPFYPVISRCCAISQLTGSSTSLLMHTLTTTGPSVTARALSISSKSSGRLTLNPLAPKPTANFSKSG